MIGRSSIVSPISAVALFAYLPRGEHEDPDGMAIEPFELHDNLVLAGGIIASGGVIVAEAASLAERYTLLAAFERCVAYAAVELLR
jgi:hypothetical protein